MKHDKETTRGQRCRGRFLRFLRNNLLLLLLITSLAVGIGLGIGMRALDPPLDKRQLMYFRFPGDLLMRMLKALIIPLIVSSLISGLAGLDVATSSKIGMYGLLYYFTTTFIAVLLGITLVMTIKPGFSSSVQVTGEGEKGNIVDSFLDLIRNMFPDNIVEACFRQTKTSQIPVEYEETTVELSNDTTLCNNSMLDINGMCNVTNVTTQIWYDFDIRKEDGMNVLGLVVYSIAMGIVLIKLKQVGRPLYKVCHAIAECTMLLITAVIWYSPIGIIFLIASEIIKMTDPIAELKALGMYMVTVLSGLAIHGFIILPLLYLVIVRKNPLVYLAGILQALITAFGTSSSSATLPVTLRCLEQKNNIDPRVTRFLLPVGATVNMDGTALYEAVAAVFIAQTNGMALNVAQVVAVSITATLASIGAASVPQAGLVTMVIVLSTIGLPAEEVSKILAIDWFIDRFRTAVNVEGDAIGSGIVNHLCRKELRQQKMSEDKEDETSDSQLSTVDKKAANGYIAWAEKSESSHL